MYIGALDPTVFSKWYSAGSGASSGVTRAPVEALPAGMKLVATCNDGDAFDKRDTLSSLTAILACPSPRFSIGVKNSSGVIWSCGTYISSTTRQLALVDDGQPEHALSFNFTIPVRPTYGVEPVPQEIGLEIAKETKNLGLLEIVDLRLEFRDRFGLKECPFNVQIQSK